MFLFGSRSGLSYDIWDVDQILANNFHLHILEYKSENKRDPFTVLYPTHYTGLGESVSNSDK